MHTSIAICDDEDIFRFQIREAVEDYCEKKKIEYTVREYSSVEEYLKRMEKADLLLLDMEMEEMSGIHLKEQLEKHGTNVRILFVTSHEEMMSEAFGKNVFGFLSKPVDKEKLKKYMDRMLEDMETYITISAADGEKTLLANDILYFQADGKFCYAITYTGKIFCNQGLSDLEPQLLKMDFIRCHRSILLNLHNVKKVTENVTMKNGESVVLARRKKEEVRVAHIKYISKVAKYND